MMTMIRKQKILVVLLLGWTLLVVSQPNVYAQSSASHAVCLIIPEFAILDVEPNNSAINLQFNSPIEGGEQIISGTENSKWINYTSTIVPGGANRRVVANIVSGSLPGGVQLNLIASNATGSGGGSRGTSAGSISLDGTPKNIINNIGRSYTGNGGGNGHQLTYSLSISNYNQLDADESTTVTVVFTILD